MHEYRRFVQAELDKRGWTAGALARKAGMHRQTISKILKDDREFLGQMPDDSTIDGIAKGFGIDAAPVRLAAARSLVGYHPETSTGIDYSPVLASIAVDADDLRDASSHVETSITTSIDTNDPDDVETLIGEVETLISDVDDLIGDITEFADIVDELATKVVGRERLQRMKQETRRFRRRQYLQQHGVSLFTDVAEEAEREQIEQSRAADLTLDRDPTATNSQDTVGETPETGVVPPPPTDEAVQKMTNEEIRNAAATDSLWADYVRSKRPELAEGWSFE